MARAPDTSHTLCRDLTLRVGDRRLLDGVTLTARGGEIVCLMGPSGVGKSVLADALFGLADPARYPGWEQTGEVGDAARIGALVFQHGRGLDHLWDWQNIALASRGADTLGEGPSLRAHSGGQRRRLLVDRALAAGRRLVWLDEPAAGLDVVAARALIAQLRALADDGVAVVVTSHLPEVAASADRVEVLGWDGRLRTLRRADGETWPDAVAAALAMTKRPEAAALSPHEASSLAASIDHLTNVGGACVRGLRDRAPAPFARLAFAETWRLVGWRGLGFHAMIAVVLAAILLLSVHLTLPFIDLAAWVQSFGFPVALRLSWPLATILAAATAGAAVASWVGHWSAQRELDGLRVLGVDVDARLLAPVTAGLAVVTAVHTAAAFALLWAALAAWVAFEQGASGVAIFARETVEALTPDVVVPWLIRVVTYPILVAITAVGIAAAPKSDSRAVGRGMTRAVTLATAGVVVAELLLLLAHSAGR